MTTDEDTARLRHELEQAQEELTENYRERLSQAQRQAKLFADELLVCAVDIAGLDGTDRDVIDVALDAVREKAREVGLLRHRGPRSVPEDLPDDAPAPG